MLQIVNVPGQYYLKKWHSEACIVNKTNNVMIIYLLICSSCSEQQWSESPKKHNWQKMLHLYIVLDMLIKVMCSCNLTFLCCVTCSAPLILMIYADMQSHLFLVITFCGSPFAIYGKYGEPMDCTLFWNVKIYVHSICIWCLL